MGEGGEKSRRQAGEMSSPEGRKLQAKGRSRDPRYTVSSGLGEHFLSWYSGVVWHARTTWMSGVDHRVERGIIGFWGLAEKLNGAYTKSWAGSEQII